MRLAFRIRQLIPNENFLRPRYGKERLNFNYRNDRLNSKQSSSISKNSYQERAKTQASATTSSTTRHVFRVISACVKTIFIAHFFCEYGYCIQPTIGASMLPTLQVLGDNVLISRSYRRGRGIQVGDVVSFASVIKPGQRVIKRVIGLPGDWVLRDTPPGSSRSMMIQVPDGHCWVVGDNLEYSRDSRHYGPVPLALIHGKVLAVVFPWKEKRWIKNGFL